ncbi:hypothetical protein K413DRAFT_4677 [Clostridium sp. ASBs410]|nr:hypothetical protein K413DRAFT_4677 [Clostridium sp. ASBs410]
MLWHEIVCDEYCTVLDGFSGTGNHNTRLKKIAKDQGWVVKNNGYARCPECKDKKGN